MKIHQIPVTLLGRMLALLVLMLLLPTARAAETAAISGTVSNPATGNLLPGAKVEIPALGRTTLVDITGRYTLIDVPAGTHELVATYIGLDAAKSVVTLSAGKNATRDFDLTSGIYRLDAFKVTGEREGSAAAITAQRNAENVKNIVAMDSYGNLPNMSVGEVVMRLPGVAGSPTDEGLNYSFNIRGMGAGLNTVTIDGALVTSLGTSRAFEMQSISGTMFDQLELTKGHRPDQNADSLGGNINLKSRSPLSMKERRRVTYSATVRSAPSFTEQIPLREQHRNHPLLTLAYQEVFDVFGGNRNVGVAANLFYSENAVGFFQTDRDFQNTAATPAYLWDYTTFDNTNNRKQGSVNVKTDYRLSPRTKLSLNTTLNYNNESFRRRYLTRAYANQGTNDLANAAIAPGYTDVVTRVLPTANSRIDVTNRGPNNYFVRMRRVDLGGETDFGRLFLDYNGSLGLTHLNNGSGQGGELTMRLANVGWILDRSRNDLHPTFTQTAGADMTNPDNYRPSSVLQNNDSENDQYVREARFNARYQLLAGQPIFVKAGGNYRELEVHTFNKSKRWNYVGTGPLPADPTMITFDRVKTGRLIPQWTTSMLINERKPLQPALWSEDNYYREQTRFTGYRQATETVTAGYLMTQGKIGANGFLAGVRTEKTETEGWGYVRARQGSTAAQQLADPIGSAQRDYAGTFRRLNGSYTKSFPSIHLSRDLTKDLKARVTWSTSFGRPGITNIMPNETINENAQSLSVNNPSLLPQTARNWDATLEYYFEPVGALSVGWFHKEIRDYIVTGINTGTIPSGTDNGYNGEYAGFTRFTSLNAGTAIVQGWEFSYQQQFTFLPGALKGLGVNANYTHLDAHGNFGGATSLSSGKVAGFIPEAANFGLNWRYRSFGARVLYNYTGDYIDSYNATFPGRNYFRFPFRTVNVGLSYQLRPTLGLTLDVANLFNEPQRLYRGVRNQMARTIVNGSTVTAGISGRF
ncbi:MAG: TonB-dependent receptor [Opitutaceae bacterium]